MSMELLQALARARLPATLTQPDEINGLLVLRAAGLVSAVTLRTSGDEGAREVARCLALTPQGRAALRDGHREPEAAAPAPSSPAAAIHGPR